MTNDDGDGPVDGEGIAKPDPGRLLIDDCFLHDKDRLRHDDALTLLRDRLSPIAKVERVPLADAHGRIAAEDLTVPRNIPAFDNAAVDGYAVDHRDLAQHGETRMRVSARVPAGHPSQTGLVRGTAVRIFTGAVMPVGADTVIMQEDVRRETVGDENWVMIPGGVREGINCRRAGEDLPAGGKLLEAGTRLRPQDLAAIASVGLVTVQCYTRLKVALISTGDEIIRPGDDYAPGLVYDSNHFLLRALLESAGVEVEDFGVIADDAALVHAALKVAALRADVIMTTGGASRGEEDHVVATIAERGSLHAWQLAIKPGRPLAFGQLQDTVFLGLPGNPVAVMVCFLLYAKPMLSRLAGGDFTEPNRFMVKAGFSVALKKTDRREFLRGWLEDDMLSGKMAKKYDRDGSGLISSLRAADGLIELPESTKRVAIGDPVAFIPFSEFGIVSRS